MQLSGKRFLITGGGRGIGRAIALQAAAEGADVCVTARTREQIEEVASEVAERGRRGLAISCDVSDPSQAADAIDRTVAELGGVDILINNAGGGAERVPVGEDDPKVWKEVVDANFLGTYYFSRAVLGSMKESGQGHIINIGSGMGHEARAGNSSYNSAKAAVWMFTRCLALEVWDSGILVNEVIPGPVYTELTAGLFERHQAHPAVPSEFVKDPDDVVPLVLFLAKQGPHGPTGQSFSLARRPF